MRSLSPSALSAVAGVTALIGTLNKLKGISSQIIGNFSHFESLQAGLETFFQSADKGRAKFEELRKLSNETTFGVDELTQSFTELANVGVDVDTINSKLMMLGNISGGNKQKFAELVSIYSKIQSTGKATAIQLQQLASRGIPIYDMLKQIGVSGQATGKQVTEAFERMTAEGGQFYNAMENINNTIEGKEGFISDYWKELTVNFAELTEMADTYKKVLDVLKDAIGTVSDKLLEWQDNPMMKAIITGSLVGILTALISLISISLVSALKLVIAKLITINALSGVFGAISLAIGAVVGLGVAVSQIKGKEIDVNEELERQIELRKQLADIPSTTGVTTSEKSATLSRMEAQLGLYKSSSAMTSALSGSGVFKGYFDVLHETEVTLNQLKEREKKFSDEAKKPVSSYINERGKIVTEQTPQQKEYQKLTQQIREYQANYDKLMKSYEENSRARYLEENIKTLEEEIRVQKKLEKTIMEIDDLDPFKKYNEEIKKYNTNIEDLNKAYNVYGLKSEKFDENGKLITEYDLQINIDPSYKAKLDDTKKYIQKQLEKVEINLEVAKQDDWQVVLQNALNLSGKDVKKGYTASTITAFDEAIKKIDKVNEKILKFKDTFKHITNESQLSLLDKEIQELAKAFNTILSSEEWSGKESSLEEVSKKIQKLKQQRNELYTSTTLEKLREEESLYIQMSDYAQSLTEAKAMQLAYEQGITLEQAKQIVEQQKATDDTKRRSEYHQNMGEDAKNSMASSISDTDVGMFVQASLNGANAGDALLAVIIQDLVGMLGEIKPVLSPIQYLLKGLEPVIKMIGIALSPIAIGAKYLGDLIKSWFGNSGIDEMWDSINSYLTDTEANLVKINEEYKKLLSSMKEQEDYYLAEKRKLLSEDYVSSIYAKPTQVNDMILTDKGVFSTDPKDTIMAMKNPSSLMGSGTLQPIINNYAGDEVSVRQESDSNGITKLIVDISKKVAQDYAEGSNGWDNAVNYRNSMANGRSMM